MIVYKCDKCSKIEENRNRMENVVIRSVTIQTEDVGEFASQDIDVNLCKECYSDFQTEIGRKIIKFFKIVY